MQFDPNHLDGSAIYKLITGAVIPRPIGWVSSISTEGIGNLAPFSFFNVISEDPPHLMFSCARTGDRNKDTLNNILANKQFVVNMVTEETVEKMNLTAQLVPHDVDEFELAGLTPVPSVKIKPARVGESLIHFECELVHHYFIEGHSNGGAVLLVGRIVMMHFDDSVLLDGHKINLDNYKPVSRLAGANYATLGELFTIKRPV
ncbi:flavin reductase family protein [Flavobacterium silvaticum]|uniref:Flavin reductase family protein n=1 Tax=Flavobacterium silvaticum TaxID=1852020 RepID=A0A972JJ50_9FLAO|nr:flavin reductase family protein [Flavobacterium silvaticum]NMH28993.1 flavin reductase family protein [Flavobacterium silvaticum]